MSQIDALVGEVSLLKAAVADEIARVEAVIALLETNSQDNPVVAQAISDLKDARTALDGERPSAPAA